MSALQVTQADAKTKNLPVIINNLNDSAGIWLRSDPNQTLGDANRNVKNGTKFGLVGNGVSGKKLECVEVYELANPANRGWVKMSNLAKMAPTAVTAAPPSVAPASPSVATAPSASDIITAADAENNGLLVLVRSPTILLRTSSADVKGEITREVSQGTRMRLRGDGVENQSVYVSRADSDKDDGTDHGWAYMQDLQLANPREKSAEDIFYEYLIRAIADPEISQLHDSDGRGITEVLQSLNMRAFRNSAPNDYETFRQHVIGLMKQAAPRAPPIERSGEGGSHRRKGKGKPSRRSRRSKRNRKNTHKRRHHRR